MNVGLLIILLISGIISMEKLNIVIIRFFSDSYDEQVCGGTMYWYFKGLNSNGRAIYEGRLVK